MDKQNYFGMYLGQSLYQETETQSIEWSYWTNQKGINDIEKVWITEKGRGAVKFKNSGRFGGSVKIEDCKLILRPLSEMTDDDSKKLNEIAEKHGDYTCLFSSRSFDNYPLFIDGETQYVISFLPEQVKYLIKNGYDIFDLKSKGWAVYESDLKGEIK